MQGVTFVGIVGFFNFMGVVLQGLCYIAFIMVAAKALHALNIYINKNS